LLNLQESSERAVSKPIPCATFEGSPVSRAIETLCDCSDTEAAAALVGLADRGRGEKYRNAARKLRSRGTRPKDDDRALAEAEWRRETGLSPTDYHAATAVAATLTGEHSISAARDRLAKKLKKLRARKCPTNKSSIKQMQPSTASNTKEPAEDES
jgi:hypothetical protein